MKFLSKILLIMAICEEQVFGISPEQAAAIARLKGLMARLNQAKESFLKIFSSSFRFDCISDCYVHCSFCIKFWKRYEKRNRNRPILSELNKQKITQKL